MCGLAGLENFEGFHKLERLGAAENELPSVATVKRIISGMKVLVDLDLHGNPLEAEPQWRLQLLQHAKLKVRLGHSTPMVFPTVVTYSPTAWVRD